MKIGFMEDMSASYFNMVNQESQMTTSNSRPGKQQSFSERAGLSDSVEISEDAYDSLAGKGKAMGPQRMDAGNALSDLVDAGTITRDQSIAITEALRIRY